MNAETLAGVIGDALSGIDGIDSTETVHVDPYGHAGEFAIDYAVESGGRPWTVEVNWMAADR